MDIQPEARLIPIDLPRIEHETLNDRVYREIRNAVSSGTFLPGHSLTLRELSTSLGVSITPVRSAVTRLAAEGGLVIGANKNIKVRALEIEEFEDLCTLRENLEGYAAARAAQLQDPRMQHRLRAHNSAMSAAAQNDDRVGFLAHNKAFHFEIYRAACGPFTLDAIRRLWLASGPHLAAAIRGITVSVGEISTANSEHSKLIDAIDAGDTAEARRLMLLDLRQFRETILSEVFVAADSPGRDPR